MPKLEGASIARKISLSDIIDTGNIREDYQDIEELAASIKQNGQLQPVIVKNAEPAEDGSPRFELIAGFRRRKAFQWLKEHGDDFSMIDAVVVTGDKLTIQLIENIQRSDLSSREREQGMYLMTQNGLSQKEIAAKLSKTEVYVSRHVTAYKIRRIADAAGIDTAALETSVISEIQAVKEKDIPMVISYIIRDGGTKAAAREIMKAYRPAKPKPPEETATVENLKPPEPEEGQTITIEAPSDLSVNSVGDVENILGAESVELTGDIAPALPPEEKQTGAKPQVAPRSETPRQPIPHKKVDINEIFDEIYSYLSALEKRIKELGPDAEQSHIDEIKREAALDIIALIHKRIDPQKDR
jgi:ParB family chromosome partitioning protein